MQSDSGQWHFITPDGRFFRWTGAPAGATFLSGSVLVDTLDPRYHAEPALLHDAPDPAVPEIGGSTVAIVGGNRLLVTFGAGFVGDLPMELSLTDGIDSAVEFFTVEVTDDATLNEQETDLVFSEWEGPIV